MSEETFARSVVKSFKGFLTIVPMLPVPLPRSTHNIMRT